MNKLTLLIFSFICCIALLLGCSGSRDYIITEKDIIPEGTAYNSKSQTIYIGSIYRQKIIGISTANGVIQDEIKTSEFGDLSPIGMEMDEENNVLFVNAALAPIVNQTNRDEWRTALMAMDMTTKKVIKRYDLKTESQAFLNDLTLTRDGQVFATEMPGGKIYTIDKKTEELKLFLELTDFHFPNGITFYESLNCLFVATDEGIIKIDIPTKETTLLECKNGINAKVIDGLAIYDDYFIGHQSSKVMKFYFDEKGTTILKSEVLDAGPEFDSSTTGEVGDGFYHFIVNSQIKSGIFQAEKRIKPLDSLEDVIIRRIKL